LLFAQISFTETEDVDEIYFMSVDGIHCRINKPIDAAFSKNKKYYSHKYNQAGVNYEIGLSIYRSKLMWMNGPFPASTNDVTIYREHGLKEAIPEGKIVVADRGYRGQAEIATQNRQDDPDVRKFKSRARARHESFNSRIKNFKALSERFRHKLEKHQSAFEAVCVICQYQMENGSPLFEV